MRKKPTNEKLPKVSSEWQKIIQAFNDPVLILDKNFRILNVNRATLLFFDKPEKEILGQTCYRLMHNTDTLPAMCPTEKIKVTKRREETELYLPDKDIWVHVTADPLFDTEGNIEIIIHVIRDITAQKLAEETLLNEKQKFLTLLENAPFGMVMISQNGTITYTNQKFREIFGYEPEDIPDGRTWFSKAYPDAAYRHEVISAWKDDLEEGRVGEQRPRVFTVTCEDGSKKTINFTPVMLATGDNFMACEDITERLSAEQAGKRAEDVIRDRERLFTLTLDDMVTFVALLKPDGEIIFVNNTPLKLIGKSIEQVRGMKFYDVDWWAYSHDIQQLIKEDVERCASGEKIFREVQIRTLDRYMWIDFSIHPIFGEDGNILYLIPEGRDITKRKEAEETLMKAEAKYRSIFENAVEGIFQTTPQGQFLSANPAMARMAGYDSPEELISSITNIGQQLYVNPNDRVKFFTLMKERGRVEEFEVQQHRKDRSPFWALINARAVKDEMGNILYSEGTFEDITLRKEAEEKFTTTLESLRRAIGVTIQVVIATVEARDPYTAGHQRRVTDLARAIATGLGLSADRIEGIRMASSIHDIGKISIPAEILSKPTKLTDIEFALMKAHAQYGYEILKDVESPWPLAEIVLQHHERINGSGYPRGLQGKEILMEAKILAVADVVESMASHRPYRAALGLDAALEEIEDNAGILYDSNAVDVCLQLFREKGFSFE